jgi:hypothetical protein
MNTLAAMCIASTTVSAIHGIPAEVGVTSAVKRLSTVQWVVVDDTAAQITVPKA